MARGKQTGDEVGEISRAQLGFQAKEFEPISKSYGKAKRECEKRNDMITFAL